MITSAGPAGAHHRCSSKYYFYIIKFTLYRKVNVFFEEITGIFNGSSDVSKLILQT